MNGSVSWFRALRVVAVAVLIGACFDADISDDSESQQTQASGVPLVDAALRGAGAYGSYTYVFRGSKYRRVTSTTGVADDGGSLPLFAFHLPTSYQTGVDAALDGSGAFSNYAYFFRGANYARYDWTKNEVDLEGTLGESWNLPPPFSSGIDAAVNGEGAFAGKAFFFKGDQYVRYDWNSGHVDAGYPLPLSAWSLPAPFTSGIDTVIPLPGKLAFVRGDSLVFYTWSTGAVSSVHAVLVALPWLTALDAAPTRRVVLYVTIDTDPVEYGSMSHTPNIQGLQQALWTHPPTASYPTMYVDEWWMAHVTIEMLADPHVLAVFSAGSFTEWIELRDASREAPDYKSDWRLTLEAYVGKLWQADVPLFAVCGSHQLFAGIRGGWKSVRHLGTTSTIQDEITTGVSGIPGPRYKEWAITTMQLDTVSPTGPDRLFAGIASQRYSLTHADEVRNDALPPEATRIATRNPPQSGDPYTLVQALKYTIAGRPDRIVYTTQFHPEHAHEPNDGAKLIQNFADLALQYWAAR